MSDSIEKRASFQFIRYANCWEDTDILYEALAPFPGKRMLSIASGGDNSFALLEGGAEVIAADLSTAQLACVELKRIAMRNLEYEHALAFLGVRHGTDRLAVYRKLKGDLPLDYRAFWDAHEGDIEGGFIHAGKFEKYFTMFRTRIIPLIHSRRKVDMLMAEKAKQERTDYYASVWNNWRWRMLFKVFFSRFVMGKLGRDPEFFKYVEGSVADRILERTKYALTELPTHKNSYLMYIMTGNFSSALPRYLRPGVYESVRDGLDRLTLYQGTIQDAAARHAAGGFDGFNLSDIFEYLDEALTESVYGELLDRANTGARFAYWNMLVPRSCPAAYSSKVESLTDLAEQLFARDVAFFYSAFIVEEVRA